MQETFMLFHDCEHSGEKANYISDSLLKLDNGSELKWNFMKAFMLITLNENHDTVELSIEDLT
jgi:hypothetical protein